MVVWTPVFERKLLGIIAHPAAGAAFLVFSTSAITSRLFILPRTASEGGHGLRVFVNSSFHQFAIDWTAEGEAAKSMQDHMLRVRAPVRDPSRGTMVNLQSVF